MVSGQLTGKNPGSDDTAPPALSDADGWNQPQYYTTIQCADIDGDGQAELLARDAYSLVAWKFTDHNDHWQQLPNGPAFSDAFGWNQPQYYTTIQFADIDGDGQAELLARGVRGIQVHKYDATTLAWQQLPAGPALSDANGWNQPQYYTTIQCADIDGDGQAELLARDAYSVVAWKYDATTQVWQQLPNGPAFSDAFGWNQPQYYTTIQLADIDGDGQAELLARGVNGLEVYKCDKLSFQWQQLPNGPALSDANGWNQPQCYTTIQCADIDGDGQAELLARCVYGLEVYKYDASTQAWRELGSIAALNDANGWGQPQYYTTIQCADIDGDGQAELLARDAYSVVAWKYAAATQVWQQLPNGPAFSDAFGWNQPQYYTTIQFADINGTKQQILVARDAYSIVAYLDDVARHGAWQPFPGLGPVPPPTPTNVASVHLSLTNMDNFVNQFHDYFQDKITQLYELSQVVDADPGQTFVNAVISLGIKAIGAAPVPGAGVISGVLGGIFTFVSTYDPRGDLNKTFADAWARFSQNLLDTKAQIAKFNSALEEHWTDILINQATGQTYLLADLATAPFPEPATAPFNDLLTQAITGSKTTLWKEVIPQRWNKVSMLNMPSLTFDDEQQCRAWIASYIEKFPNYYLTYRQTSATWPAKGNVWRVEEWWLGYGLFPYGHHKAPAVLCNELFTDDGLGNIVRPDAIATRKEVFTQWDLPVQWVTMPSSGGNMSVEVRTALTLAHVQNAPAQLAGQNLAGAVLQQAALANANLAGITARGTQLAKSDLKGANLANASLPEADLSFAQMQHAQLPAADLTAAYLQFADASGADLRGATLSGALALGLRAPAATFAGAILKGAVLRGANLQNADLTNADLSEADLTAADLRGAKLDGATLAHATLRGANLTGAALGSANPQEAETIFALGLLTPPPLQTSRLVRCVAHGSAVPFDATTFLNASHALADMLAITLPVAYGQLVESFAPALATFALLEIPLLSSAPGPTLSFGTSGPAFYRQVAQQMQAWGVSPERIALLGQLGSTASYCPFGFRSGLLNPEAALGVELQGPMGLSEVTTLLEQAAAPGLVPLVQRASDALSIASVMLTTIDFSLAGPLRTRVYFAVNPGNAVAFANLLDALQLTWPAAPTIDQWLARTTTPYLLSLGIVEGNSTPELGVYLPNDSYRNTALDTWLDTAGQSLLTKIEALTTQHPLTLAYTSIVQDPEGTVSIAAQIAFNQ